MDDNSLSNNVKQVMKLSREEAIRLGHDYIGAEHLMLGLISLNEGIVSLILEHLSCLPTQIKHELEDAIAVDSRNIIMGNLPFTPQAERVLYYAHVESRRYKSKTIGAEHLLLGILKDSNSLVTQTLNEINITYSRVDQSLKNIMSGYDPRNTEEKEEDDYNTSKSFSESNKEFQKKEKKKSMLRSTALDNFGTDLTQMAKENQLDPIVGRAIEMKRLIQILSRRKKNNPILIGEPGVGKTAIIEGLSQCIVEGKVPRVLLGKHIIILDMAALVAGTKYRGQFEERVRVIVSELKDNSNFILFIDEIHTIVGAGGAGGSLDASNLLKPALTRGNIQIIGATTYEEYRQYIEKDGALERRFQKVIVEPASEEQTYHILCQLKSKYEEYHKVKYSDKVIKACVELTNRYIKDHNLPDKAIDVMDEVGAYVHLSKYYDPLKELNMESIKEKKLRTPEKSQFSQSLTYSRQDHQICVDLKNEEDCKNKSQSDIYQICDQDVAKVVSMISGISVNKVSESEGKKLLNMEKILSSQIIGQDEAIIMLSKSIRLARSGIKAPNRPIGCFVFLGPTGVGKTALAKTLSQFLFDREDSLIRIDMSEFMERHSVSKLIGAPPGYVGYGEGGILTERVRQKPFSVVLLDEIEKAHPDIFNILLQIMDDGSLTDKLNRKVDFRNTIVIMTSNVGASDYSLLRKNIGFLSKNNTRLENSLITREKLNQSLKQVFSPEFLNRLDATIIFNTLNKENIVQIVDILLDEIIERLKSQQLFCDIKIDHKARSFLAEKGFDPENGVRPLRRVIQYYIEEPLADTILLDKANFKNNTVFITKKNNTDKLQFNWTPITEKIGV